MMYWGTGMGGWGMLLMTFGTLLFWGLVIGGIAYAARQFRIPRPPVAQQTDPRQILAARYARSEIDDEEYRRRLDVLRNGHSTG
jgi:putative membrane protein